MTPWERAARLLNIYGDEAGALAVLIEGCGGEALALASLNAIKAARVTAWTYPPAEHIEEPERAKESR